MTRARIELEVLEDRVQPAQFGLAWADTHLTLSFAPDNTPIAGSVSSLPDQLNRSLPSASWQREILRAFQTWAAQTNLNLSVVQDNGAAFGTPGPLQGSMDFGDIRIGNAALSDSQLAVSIPFDLIGTSAGDVFLNRGKTFSIGGTDGSADLFSVMLHEAGHVFGLPESTDPNSPRYDPYQGVRTGLTANDVSHIQALYGVRRADGFETNAGNESLAHATSVGYGVLRGDLTTLADRDFYRVTTSETLRVGLRTSGVSLLAAKVSIYDANGQLLQSGVGDTELTIANTTGATYYIHVEKASDDVFGIGSYDLCINATAETPLADTESGSNDRLSTATTVDAGTHIASLTNSDTDVYAITAPAGTQSTLVIAAWATTRGAVDPTIRVYDKQGRQVKVDLISDDAMSWSAQVAHLRPGQTYYVSVSSASQASGNYVLAMHFRAEALKQSTFAAGNLSKGQPSTWVGLSVAEMQLFHFELSARQCGNVTPTAVQMVIFNDNGEAVFSTMVTAGSVSINDVWLAKGRYTIRFLAFGTTSRDISRIAYRLEGYARSESEGLTPIDPTLGGVGTDKTPTIGLATPDNPYYVVYYVEPIVYYSYVDYLDPYLMYAKMWSY